MKVKLTKKDEQELFDRVSKYLADVSKLVIAGVVLTSITKEDLNLWVVIGLGLTATSVLLVGSYLTYSRSKMLT